MQQSRSPTFYIACTPTADKTNYNKENYNLHPFKAHTKANSKTDATPHIHSETNSANNKIHNTRDDSNISTATNEHPESDGL